MFSFIKKIFDQKIKAINFIFKKMLFPTSSRLVIA